MLLLDQAKKRLQLLLLPNKLLKLLKQLMLLLETPPTSLPLTLNWLMLELQETYKFLVMYHLTHTQQELNGLEITTAEFLYLNILMDLTQLIFMRPTALTLTETTRLHRYQLP